MTYSRHYYISFKFRHVLKTIVLKFILPGLRHSSHPYLPDNLSLTGHSHTNPSAQMKAQPGPKPPPHFSPSPLGTKMNQFEYFVAYITSLVQNYFQINVEFIKKLIVTVCLPALHIPSTQVRQPGQYFVVEHAEWRIDIQCNKHDCENFHFINPQP